MSNKNELPIDAFTLSALKELSLKKAMILILAISVIAFTFLLWLIYFKGAVGYEEDSLIASLPALNALFNSLSTLFLVNGYVAIRRKNIRLHMRSMLAAFISSTFFLVSYVIYHHFHGHTVFPGEGTIRTIYLILLISHIVLSAVVVPFILGSFYLALSGKIALHRKLSRYTFPAWVYVSITGVMIFFFLRAYTG